MKSSNGSRGEGVLSGPRFMAGLLCAIFLVDLFTPSDLTDWALYFIPILLTLRSRRAWVPMVVAVACVVMSLGDCMAERDWVDWEPVVRRLVGAAVMVASALIISSYRRESETKEKWADAFNNCAHGIVMAEPAGNTITACNPAYERLLGRARSDLIGMKIVEQYPEKYRERVARTIAESDEKGQARHESCILRADGSELPVQVDVVSVRDAEGKIIRRVATAQDISQRRQAEAKIAEEAARRRILIDGARDGIVVLDQEGRVFESNRRFAEMLGYSDEEVRQLHVWDWDREWPRERVLAAIRELGPEGARFETRHWRKDGSVFSVELANNAAEMGGQKLVFCVCHDITKRKAADAALRQRVELQEQLARIADTVPGMICSFRMKPDGSVSMPFATAMIEEIYGFKPEDVRDDFSPAFALMHPEDVGHVQQTIAESARTMSPWRDTFRVRHPKRGERWLEGHSMPSREADGSILWHGFVHDITERKQAEQLIRETESRFAKIFMSSPVAIGISRIRDRRFLDINDAFAEWYGCSREEFVGKTSDELNLWHSTNRDKLLDELMQKKRATHFEAQVRRGNGEIRDVVAEMELIELGGEQCMLGILSDVTERKDALKREQLIEARYRALIEHAPDGVVLVSAQGKMVYASPSAKRMFGFESLDNVEPDKHTHPDDLPAVLNALTDLLKDPSATRTVQYRFRHADGSWIWIESTFTNMIGVPGVDAFVINFRDIRERKQAETALNESLMFRREAEKIGRIGAWKVSPQTDYLYWTEGVYEIIEAQPDYKPGLEEGMMVYDAESVPALRAALQRALQDGTPFVVEAGVTTMKGRHIWTEVRGLGRIGEGEESFVMGTFQDITERKLAEDAMRASEERFRGTLDTMLEGCQIIGFDWRYLYLNATAIRQGRRTVEDMFGQRMMDLYPGIEDTVMFAELRRCMTKRKSRQFENEFIYPDGSKGWFQLLVQPVPEGIFILSLDITERKTAEAALNRSEARYRGLVETSFDWIWEVNELGRYTYASPKVLDLLGYTADEVIGKTPFDFMPEDEAQRVGDIFGRVSSRREPFSAVENVNRHKDGHLVILETSAVPVFSDAGEFQGYRGMDRDITERKRLEQQVRQAQKMEAIGRLAGGIAHDFNNILQAIFGFCDILQSDLPEGGASQRDVGEIQKAATRAASLTSQLLAFGRRQLISPTVLDLNNVILDAEKMLSRLVGEDVEMVNKLSPGLSHIKADAGNMQQVIMNLVVNARDAMPSGGRIIINTSEITISEEDAVVMPDARPGRFVCLAVTDTGCGMNRETIAQIFEPFFTTKGPDKGTGLGLSVIYGIVKQHEGWINVYSEVGQGSTFRVYLPAFVDAAALAAGAARKTAGTAPLRGHGERILLLEDDDSVSSVVLRYLKGAGYEVQLAMTAEDARQEFDREGGKFDLLFTDVVLPDGNGFDIAEEFRARKAGLQVLLSSGYTDERSRWGDSEKFGFHYIAKPYLAAELLKVIQDIFRQPSISA